MPDLISILGKRFTEGGVLDRIVNVASIPQHLITSAFGRRDYLSNLQKGIDPSEFLPNNTSGVLKFGVDVLADPLNLIGVGIFSKLAKGGKISKGIKAGDTLADMAKAELAVDESLSFIKELGQASVRKKSKAFNEFMIDNMDIFSSARKTGISKEDAVRLINSAGDDLDLIKSADIGFGTGNGLERAWHAKQSVDKIRDAIDKGLDSTKALESAIDPLKEGIAKGTEAARALQMGSLYRDILIPELNLLLKGKTKEEIKVIKAMLGEAGLDDFSAKGIDKFVEWATMSKLWGVSTVIKNTIGNTFSASLVVPEKFMAGVSDAIISGVTGKPREVFLREAIAETAGIVGGFKQAFKDAWKVMVDPTEYLKQGTKLNEAIRGGRGAIEGTLGEVIRAPGRILVGEDVFFRSFLKNGNLRSLATKEALKKASMDGVNLRGPELAKKVTEILTGSTKEGSSILKRIEKIADKNAAEKIFQRPLSGIEKTVDEFRSKHPFVRLFVPFFKTPVNLFKQSAQRIPILGSFATPGGRALLNPFREIKSGSAILDMMSRKEFISTMMARQTMGGLFLGAAWSQAVDGNITGLGPKSKAKRNAMRLSGWQPQSIRVGDKWYSYRGFEPMSSWMRSAADAMEGHTSGESVDKIVGKGILSFVKQFSENPFLMGVNDIFEGINDPERKWANMFAGLAVGSTVPNIIQQWNRTIMDPVIREPKTLSEKIFARLPLLSEKVAPRKDIFGETIVRDDAWKSLFGFNISNKETEKTYTELARLEMGIGKPSRMINGIELTDKEYDRFYVLKGAMLKSSIARMVNYKQYERFSDEHKKKILSKIIRRVNRVAKSEIFATYYLGGKK